MDCSRYQADSALHSITRWVNFKIYEENKRQTRLTRPVAPQHASRDSSITTPIPPVTNSRAANVPVIPLPTTTTSAVDGRSSEVRWPSNFLDGSRCQYEWVLLGVGSSAWPRPSWVGTPVMMTTARQTGMVVAMTRYRYMIFSGWDRRSYKQPDVDPLLRAG